jgi:hypothetical protein
VNEEIDSGCKEEMKENANYEIMEFKKLHFVSKEIT